jgi:hypothetical protein
MHTCAAAHALHHLHHQHHTLFVFLEALVLKRIRIRPSITSRLLTFYCGFCSRLLIILQDATVQNSPLWTKLTSLNVLL